MVVVSGKVCGIEEVAAPQLGRVQADLVGCHVEHPLDQLGGLGPARAPVGADRRRVGHRGRALKAHLRDVVDADRHHLGEHRQDGAEGRDSRPPDASTLASSPTILPSPVRPSLACMV